MVDVKTYGETNVESESNDATVCRQIIREVIQFGVSQNQLLILVELLAMELENRDHLQRIASLVKDLRDNVPKTTLVV